MLPTFLLRGSMLTHMYRFSFRSSASIRSGLMSFGEMFFFAFTSNAVWSPMIQSTSNPEVGRQWLSGSPDI